MRATSSKTSIGKCQDVLAFFSSCQRMREGVDTKYANMYYVLSPATLSFMTEMQRTGRIMRNPFGVE